jgi:hypothetical protein
MMMDEIETTREVPQDLKQKVIAIWPKFEPFWSSIERVTQDSRRDPHFSKLLQNATPEERPLAEAVFSFLVAIGFIEHLGNSRAIGVIEIATAQYVIPDREGLDRILRYEAAVERSLDRADNRLERLQRRRKGEPVPPPVSVRLTQ